MVIEFSLANFRSFHVQQTLSFRATGLTSEVDSKNLIVQDDRNKFLKIVGIYGANASGKSNLIKGLSFFQDMVDGSLESDDVLLFGINPYKLASEKENNSGYFQMVLSLDDKKFRYGFTLDSRSAIQTEWLFGPAQKNETFYFKRRGNEIEINQEFFKEGDGLPKDKLRKDTLFLTFCTSYDGPTSKKIRDFISDKILIEPSKASRPQRSLRFITRGRNRETTDRLINNGNKEVVLGWLREAGLTYTDVSLEDVEVMKNLTINRVRLQKSVYDQKGEQSGSIQMDLDSDESEGTQKFYSYIGDLYERFQTGGMFVSDEIDSNFHPSLLRRLICLFQDVAVNKLNAQLLFTSHDTSLMSPDYMRRDQFYFTEKTVYDETRLYSLADLRGIRNNADFARQYLGGFYGALPQLGNYLSDKDITN
ncbi:ATP/GTP-binding protein [Dyadobacter sp. 3J3]|uniref:AAA family ATPase n=1 Tax=Dyadobacter sp. 3J3 TaxID=2606600 RepID=UPI0013583FB6|nr:ATP-binding protein [Dyadobacter sp. 3J3]